MSLILTNADPYILVYRQGDMLIFVEVFVYDLALTSQSQCGLKWLKSQLINEFKMKNLGKIKIIIRCEILRDMQVETLKID